MAFNASIPSGVLRVGLDLGSHTTVIKVAHDDVGLEQPATLRIPSRIARVRGKKGPEVVIGAEAIARRHEAKLVHPLLADDPRSLVDFGKEIRSLLDPHGENELWGVVTSAHGGTTEGLQHLRAFAHQVFDRTRILSPALLMATGFGSRDAARSSIWIDIGATSVRAAPVYGGSPRPGETMVVPGGGNAVTARLKEILSRRLPDLCLSDTTLDEMKEDLAHVSPASMGACLRIAFGGDYETVDIAPFLRRAAEPLAGEVLSALHRVLEMSPSDLVEDLCAHIVLAGGGARLVGLADRLREEARRESFPTASIVVPEDPTALAARGALHWAHLLDEEEWETPVFSYVA
jgi:hypothetical protein